jgi:glutathione S-transferase
MKRHAGGQSMGELMKLYMHPASTVSRPVMLFAAENEIPLDNEMVDIMTGAHHQEPYRTINPNRLVPLPEDGNFRLTTWTKVNEVFDRFGQSLKGKEFVRI